MPCNLKTPVKYKKVTMKTKAVPKKKAVVPKKKTGVATSRRVREPSLMDPKFNMREVAKQMILLEDHLADEDKFCHDCIRKHLMSIEGLSEEAVTLDPRSKWVKDARNIAETSRKWMVNFTDKVKINTAAPLARDVRKVRKDLLNRVYDPRKDGKAKRR